MLYLREQAASFGRDPAEVKVSLKLYLDIPAISGVPRPQGYSGGPFIGTLEELAERVRAYQAHGVEHILVATMSRDIVTVGRIMEAIALEVMPGLVD